LASRLSGAFPPIAYDLALRTAFGQNQEEDQTGVRRNGCKEWAPRRTRLLALLY